MNSKAATTTKGKINAGIETRVDAGEFDVGAAGGRSAGVGASTADDDIRHRLHGSGCTCQWNGGGELDCVTAFTAADGSAIPAGTEPVNLGAGGALNLTLTPNAGGTPMGSYYTAVYHLSDGTTSREYSRFSSAVFVNAPVS